MMKTEALKLVQKWDKTFPKSDRVNHQKVTFINRYGITLAADMYTPAQASGRLPAIAVCGPFGAVHTDLYDRVDIIPFDRLQRFFEENMK